MTNSGPSSRREYPQKDILLPPTLDEKLLRKALGFVDAQWSDLTCTQPEDSNTLIGVPHTYIASGTQNRNALSPDFAYWDTYFVARSLVGTTRNTQAFEQVDNLLYLLRRFGLVPARNRFYALSHSQPPLLTSLLLDLHEQGRGHKEWLAPRIELSKQEYRSVWRGTTPPHQREVFEGLSRYYDAHQPELLSQQESGWAQTQRFRGMPFDYVPIDLNAFLYKYEMDFMRASLMLDKPKEALEWQKAAQRRKEAVDMHLWNQNAGFFFDYDYRRGSYSPVWSLASYVALWSGLASEEQAQQMASHIDKFEWGGGLSNTLDKPHLQGDSSAQWSYPNGTPYMQLFAIEGLAKYGYESVAQRIAARWLQSNLKVYEREGVFRGVYNVVDSDAKPVVQPVAEQASTSVTAAVFAILAREYLASRA